MSTIPGYLIAVLPLAAVTVNKAGAQIDYPFRNPQLSDNARIVDLLGRLILTEKVDLMGGRPQIPRFHLVFSDEAEGVHGLALGGPGSWGRRGLQPLPTTIHSFISRRLERGHISVNTPWFGLIICSSSGSA